MPFFTRFIGIACILGAMALAPVAAGQSRVAVSKAECQKLVRHTPAPDVAYKPGVDVYGRKVAPADVGGGSPIRLPEAITIDIGIDLEEKYGLGAGGKYTGEATVGKVTVRGGRVYWNGQPLDAGGQAAVADACRRIYGRRR